MGSSLSSRQTVAVTVVCTTSPCKVCLANPQRVQRSVSWQKVEDADDPLIETQDSRPGACDGDGVGKALNRHIEACGSSGLLVFRVAHKHPHRLKRPLQHSDSLTGTDFAIKTYKVVTHTHVNDLPVLAVQRLATSDIQLVDLFGHANLKATAMIKHFQQWAIAPALRIATGLCNWL